MKSTDPDVELLQAIADPVRLSILRQLATSPGSVCACDFTECCTVSQPTVSHHLKVLREAGVVTTERRGTYIYYDLATDFARRWSGIGASLAGLVPLAESQRTQGDPDGQRDSRDRARAVCPVGAPGAGAWRSRDLR